jgi:alanyl-tRNA synthetase
VQPDASAPGTKQMTYRLYYQDAYKKKFSARVVERMTHESFPAVVLDKTYFYPTSGGQPHDTGRIEDVVVNDVFVRDDDQAILHVLDGEVAENSVSCSIDWERRFDHMQQHTGQHILSQAFVLSSGAETVSFHLGSDSSTLDLSLDTVPPLEMRKAEEMANQVIWENRKVNVLTLSRDEVAALNLRKVPAVTGEKLRLIEIEEFDVVACGGTHVSRAGEIGLIKIIRSERLRSNLRIEFLCGKRALKDYEEKNRILLGLAADLTTGYTELDGAVKRLRSDAAEAHRLLRRQQKQLISYEAAEMLEETTIEAGTRFIIKLFPGREMSEVRQLANLIVQTGSAVVLFGIPGEKAQLIFARSESAPGHMANLLKAVLGRLGSTGGGGTAAFAQGGGFAADATSLESALAEAPRHLKQMTTEKSGS